MPRIRRLMTPITALLAAFALARCAAVLSLPDGPPSVFAEAGPHHVAVIDAEWRDAARNRRVPVRIYFPDDATAPLPVVLFSHGLANSRTGYEYLGRHWATHGYVVVHAEHVGAAGDLARRSFLERYRAGKKKRLRRLYADDLHFVLDHLAALPAADPLRMRCDLTRVAVAGHSFGAYAALAEAGLLVGLSQRDREHSFRDPRVTAAISMSMSERLPPAAYRNVAIPILHMTGTRDYELLYGLFPRHRRIPFDSITHGDEYLVTIRGATHSTFSDAESESTHRAHDLIRAATTAFLDAYLRHDAAAQQWLRDGGFATFAGDDAKYEVK